jgi:hypothetical protein
MNCSQRKIFCAPESSHRAAVRLFRAPASVGEDGIPTFRLNWGDTEARKDSVTLLKEREERPLGGGNPKENVFTVHNLFSK